MNKVAALKMPLVMPAKDFSFEALLGNKSSLVLDAQMLYRNSKGELYVANIDNKNHCYTQSDYNTLPENAPFQLIKGKLIYMPSPVNIHQQVSMNLTLLLGNYIKTNKLGILRAAPFDVHFDEENVFQPDLLFISNERMGILQKWVYGAPDLAVEILSKGTAKFDRQDKLEISGKYGVREYWLIDPKKQIIELYQLNNNKLELSQKVEKEGRITSTVITGFTFELKDLFE